MAVLAVVLAALSTSANAQIYNGGAITINTVGTATPYPSSILVAGGPALLTNVSLSINGFSHTFPDDMGILLQAPNGDTVVIEDGAGDGTDAVGLNWVFDDSFAAPLPTAGALVSGNFKPGQNQYSDLFAAPAPAAGSWFTTFAAAFNGDNANGTWNLLVQDFIGGDGGSITSWSINLAPEPTSLSLLALGAVALLRRRR
jgi:subtilisin-like proprotein convertase family protein